MARGNDEPPVTAVELEEKWRAIEAGVRRDAAQVLSRLTPVGLALVGVGLAALGGAYLLSGGEGAEPAVAPGPSAGAAAPLDLTRQAVIQGLIEGLTGGSVPLAPSGTSTEVSSNA